MVNEIDTYLCIKINFKIEKNEKNSFSMHYGHYGLCL